MYRIEIADLYNHKMEQEIYKESDYQKLTEQVISIAKEVGTYIKTEGESFDINKVETKNRNDFVSYVDKEAEKKLVKQLSQLVPQAGFIAEEGTASESGEAYCWVIDPLDGTTNFIHNSTPYAVSIALTFKGEPVVGVVYEITRGETFYAWKGSKAFLDGKSIQVSKVKTVEEALISTGRPHNYLECYSELMKSVDYFMKNSHGIRTSGSAAVDLVYVACGRFDGRYEFGLKPWDIAAGVLIIKQAGGKVSDFSGKDQYFENGDVLVSNSEIMDELQTILQAIFKA